VVFRGSPVRRAVSRSTGPEVRWRKLQKGVIPGEHRPGAGSGGSGRKSRHDEPAPRERTLGGSKASKRAIRPCAGESGDVCGRRVGARGNSREDTPAFGEGGKLRPVSVVAIVGLVPPPRLRVGAQWKPSRRACASAPVSRSSSNPHGSNGRRRGGTALREGKALQGEPQGRLRHETRPRSFRVGVVSSGHGATRVERGDVAQTAEGLRKPGGGTGEGLAILVSRGRRSRRSRQHGGTWSACVVGARNPRRGDTRSAGESRR